MISRPFLAAAVALAATVAAHSALAQSITSAPPPSPELLRMQERADELDRERQQAVAESERLSFEVRRLKAENERLQRELNEARGVQQATSPGDAPPPSAAGQLGTLPAEAAPGDAAQAFREARRLLDASRWPEAEMALTSFLSGFPTSPDAPEARYFLGRTQIVLGRHGDAAATFVDFLRRLPTSPRAPDAWVRLGMSLKGMGQSQQACATFRDLPAKYPNASAAVRELAASQSRLAQCPAR